jgi:creatinine amidohydrolase/Fe(II)-dependent formamide hydrolase-like protein
MERYSTRVIAELTSPEILQFVNKTSVLCLPIGSTEQHGPHLPLNTDTILAEALTQRIIARWGNTFDLWQLPTLAIGLSREHAWAPGTISLSIQTITALLRDIGSEIARTLPTRNLVVINGHGGNRGILEALVRELSADFGLNICALHIGALMSLPLNTAAPEIHGGKDETSVMLALAPHLVRRDLIAQIKTPSDGKAVHAMILDQTTSWPWRSDDGRIADAGVIGDARAASAELGQAIIEHVVEAASGVLDLLLTNSACRSA